MKTLLALIKKEYKVFVNDRIALLLSSAVPVVLILIFGSVFGGNGGSPQGIKLAFINNSEHPILQRIENALDSSKTFRLYRGKTDEEGTFTPFEEGSAIEYVKKGNAPAALIIPSDAYTDTSIGINLNFYYDPKNDLEMGIIEGMLQKIIFEQIPSIMSKGMERQSIQMLGNEKGSLFNSEIASLISKYYGIDTSMVFAGPAESTTPSNGGGFDFFNNLIKLDKEQVVGEDIENPWITRNVGGYAVMFLLFTITGAASSLFDEKKNGVMIRILSSPVSRDQVLMSKYLFFTLLGFLQLLFLFLTGMIFFGLNIFANFVPLLVVILFASIACTSFGMLLTAISKTAAQANGFGMFLILAMSATGGAWFPVSFMPDYIQAFSKITLVYWSMEGFLGALWRKQTIPELLPVIGILSLISVVVIVLSVWQFRKGRAL